MPSPDEIQKVRTNLDRMISFNKDVLVQAGDKLQNAYYLLNQTDNTDLGLQIGVNLLSGCFWELGSIIDVGGSFMANFLSGVVSYYTTETPPSLNKSFSSILIRLQNTINQLNLDLATYYQDPESNWDKSFNGSFTTPFGTYNANGKISDLVNSDFPTQDDPKYYGILSSCIKSLDQTMWSILLKNFYLTFYDEDFPPMWKLPCDPVQEDNNFLPHNKSYFNVWEYHDDTDCYGNHVLYYNRYQYNIGTGASTFSDGALNDAACDYLFQNYSTDMENEDGLFRREFVFNNLGIPKATQPIHNRGIKNSLKRLFDCKRRK